MRPSLPASLLRHSLARNTFHQQRAVAAKRFATSSTEGAQQKAQDALASIQKNAGKFFGGVKNFLEPVGERAGQLLGCVYTFT